MRVKKKYLKWGAVALLVLVVSIFYFKGQASSYPPYEKERAVLGNPTSELVIMEFSDLQCPACRLAHPGIKKLIEDHGDRFRFEFKHYPLESIHPLAMISAEAAECANDQGKFYEFVDSIFLQQDQLSEDFLYKVADELSLDVKHFRKCLTNHATKTAVRNDVSLGRSMGVQGTPSFFVNGELVPQWDYEGLLAAVNKYYE